MTSLSLSLPPPLSPESQKELPSKKNAVLERVHNFLCPLVGWGSCATITSEGEDGVSRWKKIHTHYTHHTHLSRESTHSPSGPTRFGVSANHTTLPFGRRGRKMGLFSPPPLSLSLSLSASWHLSPSSSLPF